MIVKELINYGLVLEELSLYDVNKKRDSQYLQLNAPTELGSVIAESQSIYKVKYLIKYSQKARQKTFRNFSQNKIFSPRHRWCDGLLY